MTRFQNACRALLPVLCLGMLPAGAALGAACTTSQAVSAKITQAGFNNTIFQEGGSVGLDVNTGGTKPNTQPPGLFSWSQVSGPAVTFSPTTGAHTSFVAPHLTAGHAAQIVVRLTVTRSDCTGAGTATDTVTINLANINNFPPVAVVSSSPATINPGTLVSLIGTGSYDPDNDPITYAWTQVANGAPTVTLVGATTPTATFTAPSVAATTTFRFRLTVTEAVSSALTGTATTDVNVVIANQPPVASLSCPTQVNEGATITLNGSGSTDPESQPLTYVFSQTSGFPLATIPPLPHGSSVSFPAPGLGLGQPGNVQFGLTVTDAGNSSNSKTCTVFIKDITAPVLSGAADQTVQATSAAGAVATYTVNANDNVDGASLATCVPVSGSTFAFGQTTVNCSKTDSAGNIGTASFKITVVDSTPPVIAAHANVTEEATSTAGAISNYIAPATSDAVDGAGTATCNPAPGALFALGTTAVACNATDSHGNAAIATGFSVLVQDSTAPVITPPANVSAEATGALTPVAHGVATATDAVGPLTYSNNDPGSYPVGITTIHWYAKDGAGNTSSTTSTVTVSDSTAPLVTDNTDQVLESTGASGAVATFATPTASDLVDGTLPVTCSAASGAVFPIGTNTITCSATDSHGNTGSSSFDIKVQDTTPPTIGNVADVTQEATGPAGAPVSYLSPLASDIVDGTLLVTCVPASGSGFALGDALVTCSVTDAHGNPASKTFTVHVVDTTAPALTVPTAITSEATGPSGALVSFSSSASDIVDGSVSTTCSPVSGSVFGIATTTVACSATDAHGNAGNASFTVTVRDTTPPVVTAPANMTLEATGPAGAPASFSASASDIVDGSIGATCVAASGSTFAIGTTTVTCSATDGHGNIGSASFAVTVQDKTPPSLVVPPDMTLEATGPAGAIAAFTSSASDIVDGSVATTCAPVSGSTFAIGTSTVNCSATDAHGNIGSASFHVGVVDTTPPVVTVPANYTTEATGPSGTAVDFTSSASDIVDGNVATTCSAASGSTFAIGTTTVTCSATDANHNTGTAGFTVTVRDTTPPIVTVPANYTTEATGPGGTAVNFTSSATDIVDGSVATTCSAASGSTFAIGTTTVNCSATDAHNNTGTASFTITVQDTTPPIVLVPANLIREATGASGATASFLASASDVVDGSVATTCAPVSGSTFAIGTTTVNCSATDAHNNTGTASFTVTVRDTTPPIVSVPANFIREATGASGATASFLASASDIVDGSVATTCAPVSGSTFGIGTTTVNCSATDAHNNTGTASFTVTVRDTTPPIVTVPANYTTEATGPGGTAVNFTSSATDIVDGGVTTTCAPVSGSTFAIGTTTVNCSATDAHNNTGTASFTVTVRDTTPPVVTVPANYTTEATGPGGTAVNFTSSASDIVDGSVATTCAPVSGSTFAIGTTTVNCSATDAHNNTGTASFTVTVRDTTPPIVSVPASFIREATGASGATASFLASASDIVDGSVATTCAPVSGSTFAIGTTTVNCSATDSHNNTGTASFTVTVRDTTAPSVATHSPVTVEASGPSGSTVTFSNPAANDIVDGSVTVTCAPAPGSLFAVGDSTVTCSATDAHGNTGSSSFTVHVVDTTAPVVADHADVTVEATGAAGASVTYATPTASDIVDGSVAVTCAPAPGSVFALGNTTVHCSATDSHGNTGSNAFAVHIVDTTAPVVANHANLTIEATSAAGAVVAYTRPTAADLVDGTVTVGCAPAPGSQFGLGSTTVNCSATDAHGNTGSNSFIVTVVDSTAPVIAAHADVTALATSPSGAVVTYTLPTATDLVDGSVPVTCLPASGSTFALGSTTVNCSATDSHGNTGRSSFKVIVSYNFSGFFKPVDNLPIINVVKAGQGIPVKFSLGGNMGLGIFAAGYPASGSIVCTNGPVDAVEETVTAGGSSLSYDATTGQYIYVWKSDKLWAATCRQLVVRFADGSSAKVANFNFTR